MIAVGQHVIIFYQLGWVCGVVRTIDGEDVSVEIEVNDTKQLLHVKEWDIR